MKNKYNSILGLSIARAILKAILVILPSLLIAQQSPSIQTGVSFQWSDTQANNSDPATIQSVTINGTVYNTFVVPTSYEMTRLGPDGHNPNRIRQNGGFVDGNSGQANWINNATAAFQDKNLNHYFTANPNGRNICSDFDVALTTDAQKQTIFYSPAIPSNEGGVIAVTERGGNNCFYIEAWGSPPGGGPEQKLGETFVRNVGNYRGCLFAPPIPGSDYWQSGRCNENGQTIGIGLFFLNDIAPTGSNITKIEFIAATRDHGDGKFFILQKYAVDQAETNCIGTTKSGNIDEQNNVPPGSTYSLVSGPTPAGQSFNLDADGNYSYIPPAGYIGDVTFDYQVCLPAPNTSVCDTGTVTLSFIDLPPNPTYSIECNGANDYIINVESPLGNIYEYSINGGGTFQESPTFNNVSEGTYNLIVRNAFVGCTTESSNNPIIIEDLELSGSITDVLCNPDNSGAIDITISGGQAPYTYLWSNNTTTEDITGVTAGTYTVTVTDANDCTISDDFTINQPAEELTSTIISVTDVLCFGESTGAIDLNVTGGTEPYTYSWDNGATSQDLSNVSAGDYNVTITDANGCTTTNQASINQPNGALGLSVTNIEQIECFGDNNGSITVEANGGTSPYTYSLDGGVTNQNSPMFENLGPGTYTVTVTDANDCTFALQAGTIIEPSELVANIDSVTNVLCANESTGSIDLDVTGGTQPYTYLWNNSATTQDLNNIAAGTYSVTITDANGCTVSTNATITEPANPININISKVDATTAQGCANGEATADVTGGTPPYTYQWSASANNQTTATATNLPVGTHTITVTDANNCELSQSIVIVCVNTCDAEITIDDITNVLCVGDATGSGTVSASSNANPGATFTFTWSNGQVDAGVTSSTISNITAGVYDVSVTIDGTVCQPVEETISITEPNNALSLTATSTDELGPNTGDGTASASATGGVEPYTFSWSPGGETTQNISGLSAGTYTVTVTDANDCTETATVVVNPGTCNNLSISGTSTPVVCNGESNGSVNAVVSNGVGPFTYVWDTLPNTTPSVSNLPAGSYTVTVTDQTTLCTQSTTITVNEPSELSTGIAVTNILCKGDDTGSVDLTVNGGTSPYTYLWNTGATTEDLTNVIAGNYSVTVTDANGCTATNQATVQEPAENVSGSITQITNVECLGESTGSLTVQGSGGIPPYTYSIDNGATSQTSGLFENLVAGTYTILITDANGCTYNINGTIETDDVESPEISVPSSITLEGCEPYDINSANAVFAYSETQSADIQSFFASNSDYNASDDFNIVSITYIDTIPSSEVCPITVVRTFTITDNCGNTATAVQNIVIEDTTDPILMLPTDITIECTEDESSTNTGVATGSDTCGSVTITESDVETTTCGNTKTIVRTWTATDECGNSVSADQTITVQDTTPPSLAIPANITIECTEDETSANTGVATATDTCGNVTITESDAETNACGNTKTIVRTWTATDECGNSVSADQTITVQDTTPPTLTIPADITIECTADETSTNTGVATATDTCGTITITESDVETTTCGNTKTIVRTWTATDECGNLASADQTITVQDTTPPTLTLPADVTIECTEDESSANTGEATGSDTCGDVTITQIDDVTTGCGNSRVIIRTWTVTDECGNATSGEQTITVQDTTPPTLTIPADVTIECTEDESSANTGEATGSDTCGDVTITQSDAVTAACGNTKTIIRTWTATDNCGNATSDTQTIIVEDTTPPTIDDSGIQDITIECGVTPDGTLEAWLNTNAGATSNDTCGSVTWSNDYGDNTDVDCANGTITVTFTATDDCGNASSVTADYSIVDTVDPILNLPADVTIECTEDTSPANTGTATATDDCASPAVNFTDVEVAACGITKTITRTWTATDACGNSVSEDQTITVQDTTAPTFTVPADITVECDVDVNDLTLTGDVTDEADNCSTNLDATFTDSVADGNCANESVITRTWSLTDECDNTTTLVQTITVQDTTAPTFTVPADITVECDVDVNDLTLTGDVTDEADNCSTNLDATFTDSVADGNCANESVITRTWSLTDECDNTTTLVQTITVQDTTAPTFTVPTDITVECDVDINDLTLTGDVTDEADNCSTNLDATFTDSVADGNCANESVITRTWSLTDECDNTTTLVQTITVQDTTAPTFTVPTDITVECDVDINDLTLTGDVTDEADNCSTNLDATFTDSVADGNCANESVITRTWSLTDECDNTTTLVQTITVQDTTAPTFTVPTDITVECDVDINDLTLTGDVTDEADNCSTNLDATFTDSVADGNCANESVITRTWSLTDECDNTTTLVQTITVQDTTAPTFTVPADITVECDVDVNDLTLTGDVTDEADNCSTNLDATFTDSVADGNCANESVITRTWSLTDECDNTTTLVQTITVQDTTAPTFTVPTDITVECDVDINDLTLTGDVTDEADNCSTNLDATFTDSVADGNCANESVITRTWSLTDECDNTTTLVQTITVQDTTAPTFTVPTDITVECDVDINDLTLTGDVTDEADNCSTNLDATFTDSVADGNCANESVITRTWSLTDECDNTTTLVQTITVQDTTAPTFTVPTDITVECDVDINDLTLTGDVTDEADNCSTNLDATFTDSVAAGNCANESIITRTWSLTDECDNTTTLVQTITVQDTTAPVFDVDLPSDITLECDMVPDVATITATDNCGNATVTVEETTTAGSCDNAFTLVRTWTASDDCGNSIQHTQTITVEDNTGPTFNEVLPADANAECDAVPVAETLTAIDNCGSATVTFEENITNGACIGDFIIERTWTATDICDNTTVHTQIITVQDTTPPALVTPFDENVTAACDDIPTRPDLVFEDACSNNIDVEFDETSTQQNDFEDYQIIRTWTVTDDCGNDAVFTQTINVEISNIINAFDSARCTLDPEFDLFDLLTGDFDMNGTWSVVSGNATINGSLFDPSSVEVGIYTFMYSITDGPCPTEVQVDVTIDDDCVVLPCSSEEDVIISKTVTANGDNFNEFFTISGIEDCGFVIELQIFNRWGAEIYTNNNYQNDWNGDAHGSSVGNSGKVPTGTYYYIINLRNSGLKPFAGPIYVATNK